MLTDTLQLGAFIAGRGQELGMGISRLCLFPRDCSTNPRQPELSTWSMAIIGQIKCSMGASKVFDLWEEEHFLPSLLRFYPRAYPRNRNVQQ